MWRATCWLRRHVATAAPCPPRGALKRLVVALHASGDGHRGSAPGRHGRLPAVWWCCRFCFFDGQPEARNGRVGVSVRPWPRDRCRPGWWSRRRVAGRHGRPWCYFGEQPATERPRRGRQARNGGRRAALPRGRLATTRSVGPGVGGVQPRRWVPAGATARWRHRGGAGGTCGYTPHAPAFPPPPLGWSVVLAAGGVKH